MRRPFTELFCHLIWATWDRAPLITPDIEPRVHGAVRWKLEELGCRPIAINGMPDHMHVLCQFPPTVAISYLVQQIKGTSSHAMTHAAGVADFKWQGAYGAFTLRRDDLTSTARYIERQKAHHAENELWPVHEQIWIPDTAEAREGGLCSP
jgi:putative transposase